MEQKGDRLFIGIPLSERLRGDLHALDPDIPGLRWLEPSVLHITVCFIGETRMDPEKEILIPLREIAARISPFHMSFQKLMKAPPTKKPYMVWARFQNPAPFQELHDQCFRTFLPAKGEAPEPIPHVTLGRMKRGKSMEHFELPAPPELPPLEVDHLVLWRSELQKSGAIHHPLGEAPLGTKEA